MVILQERFNFIKKDVFLCPMVDTETGKQKVAIQRINLKTGAIENEKFINCIHVALTDISTDEFEQLKDNVENQENLITKSLKIRSSESLKEFNLSPEEKFKALKSWAAGIAEAGENAFSIQNQIDMAIINVYPMIHILLRFMFSIDPKYAYEYLTRVERECIFEGVRHKTSLLSNLLPLMDIIYENFYEYMFDDVIKTKKGNQEYLNEDKGIINAILSLKPPFELFKENLFFLYPVLKVEPNTAKMILSEIIESYKVNEKVDRENLVNDFKYFFEEINQRFEFDNELNPIDK